MARALIYYPKRTWTSLAALVLFSVATIVVYRTYAPSVFRLSYISGWVLFGLMLFLAAYNGRKRLPFLPLSTSERWLQGHVYLGYLAIVVFGAHIHLRIPTGWFESSLAWLYVGVTVSGAVGLIFSRVLPKRLTTFGGEVVLERVPVLRRKLRERAEALALGSTAEGKAPIVLEFYRRKLSFFFEGPRNFWFHVAEVRRPLETLLREIDEGKRYLDKKDGEIMDSMGALVRKKDALDYHRALQILLKTWLFVHVPLTYALLLFSMLHVVLVYAFSGGAR
jgi:hypothetical protein